MARIGYARVSTIDQDLDIQLAKLKAEGCTIIRSEKVSGGSREGRPELATVLTSCATATSWWSPVLTGSVVIRATCSTSFTSANNVGPS